MPMTHDASLRARINALDREAACSELRAPAARHHDHRLIALSQSSRSTRRRCLADADKLSLASLRAVLGLSALSGGPEPTRQRQAE